MSEDQKEPLEYEPELPAITVTANGAARLLSISRSQFWKLHALGLVPSPVRIGARTVRWRLEELKQWILAGCPSREIWELHKTN
jgi:predicted DNA-binding transcriptional regulator AlpA